MARNQIIQIKVTDKEKSAIKRNAEALRLALGIEDEGMSEVTRHIYLNMDRDALLKLIQQRPREAVIA